MDAQSGKAVRRRRRNQPRRVPALVEQRERKPILFGWGADLSNRERESVKERIALIAGIGLALVIGGLIGWGLLYDNVIQPSQLAAENAKPVAVVGNYTISVGFFKRYEQYHYNLVNQRLQYDNQLLPTYQSEGKAGAAYVQQLQSEISQLQQSLNTIPSDTESILVDDQVALQRSGKAGVVETPKDLAAAIRKEQVSAGGPKHLQAAIAASGLSNDEFQTWIIKATDLQTRVAKKLAAGVKQTQVEVQASHILLPTAQKARAEIVLNLALKGENFAKLAKKYSIDTASAKNGGNLGYFSHDKMVAPFANAAFSGTVGKVIPHLVKSQFGWHIIKVTGRKTAKLTTSELQNAQQSAYASWLATQKGALHIQYLLSTNSLPAPITTPTVATQASTPVPQVTVPAVTRPTAAPTKAKK